MDYNFQRIGTQSHYNPVFPTPSFNHPHVSDHIITEGSWIGRSIEPVVTREAIHRELMKEMIREQILAKELDRLRFLEPGQPLLTHGRRFEPENRRITMPVQGRHDGSGGFEAVPVRRQPPADDIRSFIVDQYSSGRL